MQQIKSSTEEREPGRMLLWQNLNGRLTRMGICIQTSRETGANTDCSWPFSAGTTEFSKMEGITFSPNHGQFGRLYISISRVEQSMEDNRVRGVNNTASDRGGPNHIQYAPAQVIHFSLEYLEPRVPRD